MTIFFSQNGVIAFPLLALTAALVSRNLEDINVTVNITTVESIAKVGTNTIPQKSPEVRLIKTALHKVSLLTW